MSDDNTPLVIFSFTFDRVVWPGLSMVARLLFFVACQPAPGQLANAHHSVEILA
ncbi:MAG: hypothetical protein R6U28_09925 [Cyclonatronaceae bacterium]